GCAGIALIIGEHRVTVLDDAFSDRRLARTAPSVLAGRGHRDAGVAHGLQDALSHGHGERALLPGQFDDELLIRGPDRAGRRGLERLDAQVELLADAGDLLPQRL